MTASSPGTIVTAAGTGSITDSIGQVWTLTTSTSSGLQVLRNGTNLGNTANVQTLLYYANMVFHQNAAGNWYFASLFAGDYWTQFSGDPRTVWPTLSTATTVDYWDNPGGDGCVFKTPLGDGCQWGLSTDADTIDLCNGGFCNASNNFGMVFWVSQSASNPTANFQTSIGIGGSTVNININPHLVPGSYAAGPYPGDNQYCFIDTISYPGVIYVFGGSQTMGGLQSFQAGQGPFIEPQYAGGGYDDATSVNFGNRYDLQSNSYCKGAGQIRGYDVDPSRNPNFPRIQHGLQYEHGVQHLANNLVYDNTSSPLKPTSWPNYGSDFQGSASATPQNNYSGTLLYGTLAGIPITTTMPTGLTLAEQMVFWCLQHYGSFIADTESQPGAGYTLIADQEVTNQFTSWLNDLNSGIAAHIVPALRPLRNQHLGGTATTADWNGPGNRVDSGPPPLSQQAAATFTPSPNDTTVAAGSGGSITDASGNVWTITVTNLVAVNGIADTTTSGVSTLAYVNGTVWQENASGYWYGKTSPGAAWLPANGTTTSPLPTTTGGITTTTTSTGPQLLPAGYLSTKGNQIVDQNGNPVRIAGIGWSGGDGAGNSPEYISNASLPAMVTQMVSLGFNCIRLPWNDVGFFEGGSTDISSNSYNPSLVGLTPLQVMDAVVAAAGTAGLKVILDHHTNEGGNKGYGGQQGNGLWYDSGPGCDGTDGNGHTGTVTQQGFLNNWVAMATRYNGNPTVIGFDLHNEPLAYGSGQNPRVSWGDGAVNDIHAMYQNVGNAILAVNPNVLIICEGVIDNGTLTSGVYDFNLVNVKNTPVVLNKPNKVVYSVHCYPGVISNVSPDTGSTFISNAMTAWGYVVSQGIAPIWIGEMGASLTMDGEVTTAAQLSDEQAWAAQMVSFCNGTLSGGPTFTANQQGISTSWWLWGDLTGQWPDGVLQGGWSGGTPRPGQQQVYSQLQFTKAVSAQPAPVAPVLAAGTSSTVSVSLSWTIPGSTNTSGTASPDQTVVMAGSGGSITDSAGNVWTITAGGQVAINGVADTTTSSVSELAYVSGWVWQENTGGVWYGKSSPTATWSPQDGTTTSPLSGTPTTYQPQYRLHGSTAWSDFGSPLSTLSTIVTGLLSATSYDFEILAANSVGSVASNIINVITAQPAAPTPTPPAPTPVPTTVAPSAPTGLTATNVTSTSLTFGWSASATGTAPISYQPSYRVHQNTPTPTPVPSANDTVVKAGSGGSIIDAAGNAWTITTGSQVAVNGVPDGTTSAVVELAYVGGTVWQENASGVWYGKTSPTAAWSPQNGTTTSPLPSTPTPTPTTNTSANDTVVQAGSGGSIIDAAGNAWTITTGAQVAVNGVTDVTTSSVTELAYVNGVVWQENTSGYWYGKTSPSAAWSPAQGTTVNPITAVSTKGFYVSNGQIIGPNGLPFVARGINIPDYELSTACTSASGTPLLTLFPGLNFIRLNCFSYNSASYYQPAVTQLTALGVVIEFEHHVDAGGGIAPLTGADLTAESNWFASIASAFVNNPYVWFGTLNEPSGPGDVLTAEQVSNYNAIRSTGSNAMLLLEILGNYNSGIYACGSGQGLTPNSAYAAMTNVVWDVHIYNGLPDFNTSNGSNSYSTDQNFLDGMVAQYAAQAQTITSADGTVPVIFGEYGISTSDNTPDPGGTQTCIAVQNSGFGSAAWNWFINNVCDVLVTNGTGGLTAYGQQVAGWIASAAAATPKTLLPASPNNTVVTAGSSGSIVDASSDTWTISSTGQVAVNGIVDGSTSNVVELAYVGGTVWQENASGVWYGKTSPTAAWSPQNGTTTSPLPAPPTPTPNPTVNGNATVLPGGSSNPPVIVPLTGTVNPVTMTYATYNGMAYIWMPPANYDPTKRYPILLYMHQNDQGDPYYSNGQSADLVGPQIAPWFNTTSFLTNCPCFVIAPLLNELADTSGNTINFGGYAGNTQVGQTNGIAIIQQFIAQYPIDTARIYVTGNSMGGSGCWVDMLLNNCVNGTVGKVFAAGLALSGVDYDAGGASPSASVIAQIQAGFPMGAIHGATDTDQPATRFSLPLWNAVGGSGTPSTWTRAGTTNYFLLIDPNLGHDTWDYYYPWQNGQFYWQWLFSQTA